MSDLVFCTRQPLGRTEGNWTVDTNGAGQAIRLTFSCEACHLTQSWVEPRAGALRPQKFEINHCGKKEVCPPTLVFPASEKGFWK